MNDKIEEKIRELGPWRHNIDLNGYETRDISSIPLPDEKHPQRRWEAIRRFISKGNFRTVDLGCNAGGISFELEKLGHDVTGVELEDRWFKQAIYAKKVLNSEVNFVQEDVVKFLENSEPFDYSIALGLVYHIRRINKFIDLLDEKTKDTFVIESSWYDGLENIEWIEEKGVWHLTRDWLRSKVERTGMDEMFTVTRGDERFPTRGFRFLAVGRHTQQAQAKGEKT